MRFGQTVQVFNSTLATLKGSAVITGWDVENVTVTLTPQIAGVTGGDRIVTNGISTPTALPALYGVPYHHSNASTGTWLGFSRASTPEIRSNRVNGNALAITLPLPRLAINKIGNRVGIDNDFSPNIWTHPCQLQAYEEIGQLMITMEKSGGKGGDGLNLYFCGKMEKGGFSL